MPKKETGWWVEFFPKWRPQKEMVEAKKTNEVVRFIIDKLKLKKGSNFLDCPTGFGRIAIPIAKKGIKVTGVDITLEYLAELREKADKAKLPIKLFHNDMRRINFEKEFDAAGNLWTSFGYFEKESDNLLVLKKVFKALKPGGMFMLQMINRDWIIKNFEPTGWSQEEGFKILEKREFDYRTSTSRSIWTYIQDGKEDSYETSIRMYSFHELVDMFEKVGFVNIEGFGSVKDDPITCNNRDMFVIGRKPKK